MNRTFDTCGDFSLSPKVKLYLDVTIEYDTSDPDESYITSAVISVKLDPDDLNYGERACFVSDDATIDTLNNENAGLIHELAVQDAIERYSEEQEMNRFERFHRSEIMRGLR